MNNKILLIIGIVVLILFYLNPQKKEAYDDYNNGGISINQYLRKVPHEFSEAEDYGESEEK